MIILQKCSMSLDILEIDYKNLITLFLFHISGRRLANSRSELAKPKAQNAPLRKSRCYVKKNISLVYIIVRCTPPF